MSQNYPDIDLIVEKYYKMLLRVAAHYMNDRHNASDIAQSVFMRYLTAAPTFIDDSHEKAWFLRTCINLCKDHVKSAYVKRTVPLDETSLFAYKMKEEEIDVFSEIQKLPENQKQAVYLYYYEGTTQRRLPPFLKQSAPL